MQKFVVKKSKSAPHDAPTTASESLSSTASANSTSSQVKMSGYLKKKRNKIGGWRKLWFVLQNQLLLSYSSQEDYEKKLAPFKDVLNLVPGTIIRPTKGPRFTIETTTNQIYTYRCDNNKVCSEWITALVESLGINSEVKLPLVPNKLHFSLENLPKSNQRTSASTSPASSFMSSRSCDSIYRSKHGKLAPKLPVAQNTARLLERVQTANTKTENASKKSAADKVQNFRLHQNDAHVNQSDEVHRINRMFNANNGGQKKSNSNNNNNNHNNNNSSGKKGNNSNASSHRNCAVINLKKSEQHQSDEEIIGKKLKNSCFDKNSNREIIIMDSLKQATESTNCASLEEQLQRISLDNINRRNSITLHSNQALPSVSSSSASETSASSSASTASTASASKSHHRPVTASQSKEIHLIQSLDPSTHNSLSTGEPIYAVVDLKNKYARRAQLREMEDIDLGKDRPNSVHVLSSSDYEEVLQLTTDCVDGREIDENIYEPINIPDVAGKGPLWRYISKINIDTLMEIARRKKEHPKEENSTTFADIRKRFGHHRKSIKNRMKKLYNRTNSEPHEGTRDHSLDTHDAMSASTSNGGEKLANEHHRTGTSLSNESSPLHKRDRHLFGSMLRKSRTSICLDDVAPRKKLIIAIGNSAGLKRRLNRSFEEKKKECHSKFYD